MVRVFRDDVKPYTMWAMWGPKSWRFYSAYDQVMRDAESSLADLEANSAEITPAEAREILRDRPEQLADFERVMREHGGEAAGVRYWESCLGGGLWAYKPNGEGLFFSCKNPLRYTGKAGNDYSKMCSGMFGHPEITRSEAVALLRDWPEGLARLEEFERANVTAEPQSDSQWSNLPANGEGWDKPQTVDPPGITITSEQAERVRRLAESLIDMSVTLNKYIRNDGGFTELQSGVLCKAYIEEQINASAVLAELPKGIT